MREENSCLLLLTSSLPFRSRVTMATYIQGKGEAEPLKEIFNYYALRRKRYARWSRLNTWTNTHTHMCLCVWQWSGRIYGSSYLSFVCENIFFVFYGIHSWVMTINIHVDVCVRGGRGIGFMYVCCLCLCKHKSSCLKQPQPAHTRKSIYHS